MNKSNGKNKETKKVNKEEVEKTKKYKVKESKNKKEKTKKNENGEKKVKNKKKHKVLKRIILSIFILGILLCLIGAGIIAGIFFSDKFKLTEEDLLITNVNGVIKDKNGEVIGAISGEENRKIVTLNDVPQHLPKAFVAIEDKRFYDHIGIDIKRTAYVTIMYALNKGESSAGGGSTITQQLIKNLMNDDADAGAAGIERKIREMARAYNLEKILSKDQILELYLNKIPMGSTVYGVGMAAEYYFSKPVAELDIAESAFLAGINHAPSRYNPFIGEDNGDKIKDRTKEVLFQMKDQEKISEEEYNAAVAKVDAGLPFKQGGTVSKVSYSYHTAAAINQAIEDLMKAKDINKDTAQFIIENNGYTIYTTQDTTIQDRMEEEFLKDKYIRSGRKKDAQGNIINNHTQAAMVIIDHTTGQVVATVGGLGSDSTSVGLNRATQSVKQTGSSIKPIACIAPALEKGIITAGTVYDDSATNFGGFTPHNSGKFNGLMTIRTALAQSSNIVHVKVMKEVGPANSIKFLAQMGITVNPKHEALTLALGTAEVTPLGMAAAYATIANNGEYITPIFYTKVEDTNGNVVLESKQEKTRVMSEANAYVLQNLLTSPARSGTASVCYMSNMDVGAKTGSTNDYIDRWLCGFTPYYTAATWFGFDESELPVFSGNNAANIWAAVMKDVHKNLATARFKRPSNVVYAKICQESGRLATDSCTKTLSEVFVKGTIPGQCEGHTKLKICKETGKIATEYCKEVEEKTYVKKQQKENKTLTEAKKEVEKLGLKVEIKYKENTKKKDGIVLEQGVKKGTKVDKGSTITLTVNKIKEKEDDKKTNTTKNEVVSNTTTNTTTNTTNTNTTTNTTNTNTTNNNKTNTTT